MEGSNRASVLTKMDNFVKCFIDYDRLQMEQTLNKTTVQLRPMFVAARMVSKYH